MPKYWIYAQGTGNMTFEFASRGAGSVLAVDQHVGCIKFIKKAALELQLNSITALKADVFKFVNKLSQQYDIIFADPPYALGGDNSFTQHHFQKRSAA